MSLLPGPLVDRLLRHDLPFCPYNGHVVSDLNLPVLLNALNTSPRGFYTQIVDIKCGHGIFFPEQLL